MTKECNICLRNGRSGIQVNWQKIGEDPNTGKNIWKALNPDGSDHHHVSKAAAGAGADFQKEKNEQIKAMHDANIASSKALKESIDKLTEAINNAGAKLGVLGYAALDKKDTEDEGPLGDEEEGPS